MSGDTKLPLRQGTQSSTFSGEDEAVPETDPTSTAGILAERLQAWKHAVGYLEEYLGAIESIHKSQAKEYEKALKSISKPLREGHHFDQSLGGVAGFFENLRVNTSALSNSNAETEKSIKGSVLPILERLHKEIKNKSKELSQGVVKEAKEIDKARNSTQKHIELLGQHTTAFESTGGRVAPTEDPYVLRRGVSHRLQKQVLEENNQRNDIIAVQNNFKSFEAHVIATFQEAMESFNHFAGGQAEKTRALYADMLGTVQRIPPSMEWDGFVKRNGEILVDPQSTPRRAEDITFANQDHPATKALIEGSLERKSRNKLSFGYSTGYYVVTPSKYLHEFKDSDDSRKDPTPELSLFLPDATIGAPNGEKFNIKGKDKSKSISSKLTGNTELAFKAHTAADAQRWFEVISHVAGATGPAAVESGPTSPVVGGGDSPLMNEAFDENKKGSMASTQLDTHKAQEAGITHDNTVASPTAMSPADAKVAPQAQQIPQQPQVPLQQQQQHVPAQAVGTTEQHATVPATHPAAPAPSMS